MTLALVWLGLLFGLRHATEPDHLAAVASIASGQARLRDVGRIALSWGIGHSVVLIGAGAALAAAGQTWPPSLARALELASGGVLAWLGLSVLLRGPAPVTAPRGSSRALLVGGIHGVEGSGAVVLLALPAVRSLAQAIAYLIAFGIGSIAGMLICSAVVTIPLGAAGRRLHLGRGALDLVVGGLSLALGATIAIRALAGDYIRSIFT